MINKILREFVLVLICGYSQSVFVYNAELAYSVEVFSLEFLPVLLNFSLLGIKEHNLNITESKRG